jgi:asparagine synthase (glutamine-hydrolysing)
MCGIAGEIRPPGRRADPVPVEAMAAALAQRGPDGAGSWSHDRVAFGHRRLAVIDLSPAGSQPMVDPALGLTVVFNGCIYNHRELRQDLERHGHRFFSTSDTEVISKAWHTWGPACVERFVGMFAFAIAERDSGRVTLVRDRLGIKPLYLAELPDGGVRFASSIPALLAGGGVDTSIDPVALHHYLTFHSVVPGSRTILAGVRRVPPATIVTFDPDGARHEERWWRADHRRRADRAGWTPEDWRDAVHGALRTAVERRLVADVPVGVLLSGGLDSSLVVGLLAEQGQQGLATFSIGFDAVAGKAGDEFGWSDLVAERFGTEHHRIRVATGDLTAAVADAVGAMSEPMASHDVVAFHLLSKAVVDHVKVVQSGQGADEVFAGYRWYPPVHAAGHDGFDAYRSAFFDRTHDDVAALLTPEHQVAGDVSSAFVRAHFDEPGAETALDRALRLDTEVMLVDDPVKRVDNMTMAWGLEARVPFLDHDLVELAASCPPELKLANGGKGVLKHVARGVIPDECIDRPKGYFPVPALTHLGGGVLDLMTEALHAPAAKARGLWRTDAVDQLLGDPNGQLTPLGGNTLWQVGVLELWLQHHGL